MANSRYQRNSKKYAKIKEMDLDIYNETIDSIEEIGDGLELDTSRAEYQKQKRYDMYFKGLKRNIETANDQLQNIPKKENAMELRKEVDLKTLIAQAKARGRNQKSMFSNTQYEILKNIKLDEGLEEREEDAVTLEMLVGEPTEEIKLDDIERARKYSELEIKEVFDNEVEEPAVVEKIQFKEENINIPESQPAEEFLEKPKQSYISGVQNVTGNFSDELTEDSKVVHEEDNNDIEGLKNELQDFKDNFEKDQEKKSNSEFLSFDDFSKTKKQTPKRDNKQEGNKFNTIDAQNVNKSVNKSANKKAISKAEAKRTLIGDIVFIVVVIILLAAIAAGWYFILVKSG